MSDDSKLFIDYYGLPLVITSLPLQTPIYNYTTATISKPLYGCNSKQDDEDDVYNESFLKIESFDSECDNDILILG